MTFLSLIILVVSILLLINKSELEEVLLAIEKKKKLFMVFSYAIVIFSGCFNFPIELRNHNSSWITMLIGYFFVAVIFYGLYKKRPLFVFSITFVLNTIGLLCFVLLEWGEYTLTRDLTQFNVVVYLLVIPLLVMAIYYLVKLICSKR